jgi:predicted transposase YdaD
LRDHLPPDLVALLVPGPPELVTGSFVDERLRRHHTDLLFRLRWRTKAREGSVAEGQVLGYVLLEHKSAPDPHTPLQLLRYKLRIWERWIADKNGLPLPPILAVVLHQGPEGWRGSRSFLDLFGALPEALRQSVPDFTHELVDLSKVDDSSLSHQQRLRALLMVMKYAQRADLLDQLPPILAEALRLDIMEFEQILRYLSRRVGEDRLLAEAE